MLKYGNLLSMSNGVSKSLVPRNIAYLQTGNTTTTQVSGGNITNADSITASDGTFTNLNSINLITTNIDTISLITSELSLGNIVNFSPDYLKFVDISQNSYLELNSANSYVKINTALDLSTTGVINIDNNLNFKNNNASKIYSDPLIKYNIFSSELNNFEKKYLAKTSILDGSGNFQYIFKNIIENSSEQITFTGKIISRDSSNNSASFILEGYTKYLDVLNPNFLELSLLTMYSSDPINWVISAMFINGNDLILQGQSSQSTTTNWVITLESISV